MKTFVATALLGATLLTAPAFAQTPAPAPDAPRQMRVDTNGDGLVSRDEAMAAAASRFDKADANKDGKLTPEERRSAHLGGPRRGHGGGARLLEQADANRDGIITRAEMTAAADARFAARDADKMDVRDGKGPRQLTQAQARDMALKLFDRIDANHDGKIEANERETFKLMMRARMGGGQPGATPQQQ